jgi:hypothetical protein
MTEATIAYTGMLNKRWFPPAPQLIRNARMLIVGYRADRDALAEALPAGLAPHSSGLVQMNMYEVSGEQTSGFGPFSLTYLTAEVEGHDSFAAEGTLPIPGRFFLHYWNSSPRVLSYAREAAGIPAMYGERRSEINGGVLTSTLSVDSRDVIEVRASVTDNRLGTLGGHLNYYTHREFPAPSGGYAIVSELLELPLPFVVELYEARVESISFAFPDGDPVSQFAPREPLDVPSVMYGDVTFTYSMARKIRGYEDVDGHP